MQIHQRSLPRASVFSPALVLLASRLLIDLLAVLSSFQARHFVLSPTLAAIVFWVTQQIRCFSRSRCTKLRVCFSIRCFEALAVMPGRWIGIKLSCSTAVSSLYARKSRTACHYSMYHKQLVNGIRSRPGRVAECLNGIVYTAPASSTSQFTY